MYNTILIIFSIILFSSSIQLAFGSAINLGELETVTCKYCTPSEEQNPKITEQNLDSIKFKFGDGDSRKYPNWIKWENAEDYRKIIKSPLEQKIENDKITMHGFSRNHFYFKTMMQFQENIALKIYDSKNIQNSDFKKSDNYFTIYFTGKNRSDDQQLQQKIELEKQYAQEIIEKLLQK